MYPQTTHARDGLSETARQIDRFPSQKYYSTFSPKTLPKSQYFE
jgi:hypothetical protein